MFRFTLDDILNPYIPPSQTRKFPQPFRRFLGGHTPPPVADYWIWLEVFLGTLAGILLLEGVFRSHTVFRIHHLSGMIASYGAGAILCFNANLGPLAQPRNVIFGHFLSSLIGVCILKLFSLSEKGRELYYLAGALSVALLSVMMLILNCVHPPAGASALLPCVDSGTRLVGWWFLPAQLVSSVLLVLAACLTGNIFRVYPTFWWTQGKVGREKPQGDLEGGEKAEGPESGEVLRSEKLSDTADLETEFGEKVEVRNGITYYSGKTVEITKDKIVVPNWFQIDELMVDFLETMQRNLRE